jgi:hypothetical protein
MVSGRKSVTNVLLKAVVGAEWLAGLARAKGDRFRGRDKGAAGKAAHHLGGSRRGVRDNDLAEGADIAHRPEEEMAEARDRLHDEDDRREEEEDDQATEDEEHRDSRGMGEEVAAQGVGGVSAGPWSRTLRGPAGLLARAVVSSPRTCAIVDGSIPRPSSCFKSRSASSNF